jgi:hypothetical protein
MTPPLLFLKPTGEAFGVSEAAANFFVSFRACGGYKVRRVMPLLDEIEPLKQAALTELNAAANAPALEQTKSAWIGPNGKFTALMRQLGTLSKEDNPVAGKAINAAKVELEAVLSARGEELELKAALPKELADFTPPVRGMLRVGRHHLLARQSQIAGRGRCVAADVSCRTMAFPHKYAAIPS